MIAIINRQKRYPVRTRALKALLGDLVAEHGLDAPEVTLAFVGAAEIRRLNRTFMGKDEPTDVLSFPLRRRAADGKYYLGDIIIAVPVAFRQGREKGHGLERELEQLTIHGFLHLLGHDHGRVMTSHERRAAGRLRP
jgi:probable rRNA maturation factor